MWVNYPQFSCALLQVLKSRQDLWSFILQAESSDEEHFVDVDEPATSPAEQGRSGCGYQPAARNPLFCKAETSCLWELARLTCHYHPSVQAFARKIALVSLATGYRLEQNISMC